jgi:hypothetical protein
MDRGCKFRETEGKRIKMRYALKKVIIHCDGNEFIIKLLPFLIQRQGEMG